MLDLLCQMQRSKANRLILSLHFCALTHSIFFSDVKVLVVACRTPAISLCGRLLGTIFLLKANNRLNLPSIWVLLLAVIQKNNLCGTPNYINKAQLPRTEYCQRKSIVSGLRRWDVDYIVNDQEAYPKSDGISAWSCRTIVSIGWYLQSWYVSYWAVYWHRCLTIDIWSKEKKLT